MISSMEGGGSERQTLLMLRHLSRERFAPELFVLRRGGSLFNQIPLDVPIHCFEDHNRSPASRWPGGIHRAQVKFVQRLLVERAIDVVYDRTFHMTLIAGPAAHAVRIPRVSTIVSPPSRAVPLNAGRFLAIKKRRLARDYRRAIKVIAVSHPTAKDARRFYRLRPDQVTVVPNPVDSQSLQQALVKSVDLQIGRDDRFTIVCVGRMSQEKGQQDLLLAMRHLQTDAPEFPLPRVWFVGDGPLRQTLERQAKGFGLSEAIRFVGHVEEPAAWIAAADLLCLPSRFEGFPNVLLEAMAIGTAVLASDIDVVMSLGRLPRQPALRGRQTVMTYACGNTAELARKIKRVQLNSTATNSRRRFATDLINHTHTIDAIVPRLEAIMLRAAGFGP